MEHVLREVPLHELHLGQDVLVAGADGRLLREERAADLPARHLAPSHIGSKTGEKNVPD